MSSKSKQTKPPARATDSNRSALPSDSLARWASYACMFVGVLLVFHGGQQLFADAPPPLPYSVSVVVVGLTEAVLPLFVLGRKRPAWAFLVSLNGTMAVVTLFGGPRIRDTFDVAFSVALLPCLVFGAITVLVALASDDF